MILRYLLLVILHLCFREAIVQDQAFPNPHTDLLTFRIRLGLTLRDMSEKTGLSPATLHRLERGITKPTSRSRVRLQDAFDLTPEQVDGLLSRSRSSLIPKVNRGQFLVAEQEGGGVQ